MLANVSLDVDMLSAMAYALVVDKQDPAEFAATWVDEHAALVSSWLE